MPYIARSNFFRPGVLYVRLGILLALIYLRLRAYADRKPWELGNSDDEPLAARVLFRFPLSLWAERNGLRAARGAAGGRLRGANVRAAADAAVLRWLLATEGEAEVLDPPELGAELRALAARVAAVHGGAVDGDA